MNTTKSAISPCVLLGIFFKLWRPDNGLTSSILIVSKSAWESPFYTLFIGLTAIFLFSSWPENICLNNDYLKRGGALVFRGLIALLMEDLLYNLMFDFLLIVKGFDSYK